MYICICLGIAIYLLLYKRNRVEEAFRIKYLSLSQIIVYPIDFPFYLRLISVSNIFTQEVISMAVAKASLGRNLTTACLSRGLSLHT